nr:LrgB family protein [Neobacillus sp. Marseille-Q6967]
MLITIVSIIVTVSAYILSRFLNGKYASPLTNPVFFSTVLVILLLTVTNISYEEYSQAKVIMTYFLGPATVAIAVPIYKNRKVLARYFYAAMMGLFTGSVITISIAMMLAYWFHLPESILISLSVKSITTPIAVETGKMIGGNSPLIAGFVIITGIIGAMFGAKWLSLCKVEHPFARGLSIGSIAHGIGTAEAVKEGEIQGAVAGAAMGIAGIITSIVIPYVIPFFN